MTENKANREKKKMNQEQRKNCPLLKKTEKRMKSKKLKQMMKKRIIVRNLSFSVSEEQLQKIFSEFGEVLDVNIPVNEAGRKRGFAFVQFKDSKSQMKAMKALNFKKICGRPVALDFAVDKTTYQSQQKNKKPPLESSEKNDVLSEPDSDKEDEDTKQEYDMQVERNKDIDEDSRVTQFLKEFSADIESEESLNSESSLKSSSDSETDDELHPSGDTGESVEYTRNKRKHLDDVSEGKTIFIRNVSYKNNEEDLQEVMQEYGETVYCILCTDPITDHPKGTAFVKFKEKQSADKIVEISAKEPGIILDGRRLTCAYAVSREELSKKNFDFVKIQDKRNLRLLKCSLIMHGSKESEGVSQTDMTKRAQLEFTKKKKLKNVNFFVSDKRLAIHNLPKNINDKDLRTLFQKAAGKGALIKEARVMRDFKKTDSQGIPVSRGFGFVSFTEHEHALKALTELNNNPRIFTSAKRPIVEFSVENKVALLSQERKREKLKLLHKKKLEEKLMKSNQPEEGSDQRDASSSFIHSKRKKKKSKASNSHSQKILKQNSVRNSLSHGMVEKKRKTKQKNVPKNKKRKGNITAQEKNSLSVLTDKYKKKLLNKLP